MINFFKRLFKIGEAEANAMIDKMEDPIKLTEQGIRDMRLDLEKSQEALAQVKALAIRAENEMEDHQASVKDYTEKAMLLLKKGANGELSSAEADRLAREALLKKEAAQAQYDHSRNEADHLKKSVNELTTNNQTVIQNINQWESELKTLKARVKVSNATKNMNKQMAGIDSTSTVAMLERMKEKAKQEEALAQAYGDISKSKITVDDEIETALNTSGQQVDQDLEALKKKLGIKN